MSANVETCMSVREVPWHGLGTIVETAPTSKDALELAGLDWVVESKPIFDANGNEIKGFKANTRNSDNSVLGVVSDRYRIIQNNEAFEFTDNLVSSGDVRYETAGSLKNGKQIWLLAKLDGVKIVGDDVDPYVCFTNNHDGTGAIRVCMTPIRVVCQNTLNVALTTAKRSWSTKHMGDINSKLIEAKATLGFANEYMKALDEAADKFANTKISDDEIEAVLDILFPIEPNDSQRKINSVKEIKNNFYSCYMMPDIAKFRNTQWGVINAMSDMATHTAPLRKTASYQENNWGKVIGGHPFIDALTKVLAA